MAAAQILQWVRQAFDQRGYRYKADEEENDIEMTFSLDSKLKKCTIRIRCRDDHYDVNTYIELQADEECRQRVAEYITRANYGLRYGCFEMDFRDGEIRYNLPMDCQDRTSLSTDLVIKSIMIPMQMFERYGDGLVAVMYGFKTPEEAIKEAESDND